MAWPPPVLSTNKSNDMDQEDDHPTVHNALASAINSTTAKITDLDVAGAAQDARLAAVEGSNNAQQAQIDAIGGTVSPASPLVLRPWTADGSWGTLAHRSMGGMEYGLMSQPNQPTLISAFTNQPVVIRAGGNDSATQFSVGDTNTAGVKEFNFTGGPVHHLGPRSGFIVQRDGSFADDFDIGAYVPAQGDNVSLLVNDGYPIRYRSPRHIFGNSAADIFAFACQIPQFVISRGTAEPTYDWFNRTVRLDSMTGSVGISFGAHEASWAIIIQANPTSTLAPCLDVVVSDNSGYAYIAAAAFFTMAATAADKTNVTAVTDTDLLTRLATIQGQTWTPARGPLRIDSATDATVAMTDPGGASVAKAAYDNQNRQHIGFSAEDAMVATAFPELVALTETGAPAGVDIEQVAAVSLAAGAALARQVQAMLAQIDALTTRLNATPGAPPP